MELIESQPQFKYEFISHVPSKKVNIDARDDSSFSSNLLSRKPISIGSIVRSNLPVQNLSLEIVGLELNRKLNRERNELNDSPLAIRPNDSTNFQSKVKVTRVNQTCPQLPRRTTFQRLIRQANEKFCPSGLSPSPDGPTTSKSPFVSSTISPTKQKPDELLIMTQRRQTNGNASNPSVTILKKMPNAIPETQLSPRFFKRAQPTIISSSRELSPVKLPTLLKKTTMSGIKSIPSAYIQQTGHIAMSPSVLPNRTVLQPTPIGPVYPSRRSMTFVSDAYHLPAIRDHMVKVNLNQRATFKCKSPAPTRSGSSLSRSTATGPTGSTLQMKSFNPLKYMDASSMLGEAAKHQLKRLFHQLDTDRDGHLTYSQVQTCLPTNLRRAQSTFFRVLYDLTTDATYFGLQEFYATALLVDMISKQDPHLWDKLLDDVDFNYYRDDILDYLNEFDQLASSSFTNQLSFEQLVTTIQHRMPATKREQIVNTLETLLPAIKTIGWSRIEFIAFVPTLIFIESSLDQSRTLFRFRENSILDSHMKRHVII